MVEHKIRNYLDKQINNLNIEFTSKEREDLLLAAVRSYYHQGFVSDDAKLKETYAYIDELLTGEVSTSNDEPDPFNATPPNKLNIYKAINIIVLGLGIILLTIAFNNLNNGSQIITIVLFITSAVFFITAAVMLCFKRFSKKKVKIPKSKAEKQFDDWFISIYFIVSLITFGWAYTWIIFLFEDKIRELYFKYYVKNKK